MTAEELNNQAEEHYNFSRYLEAKAVASEALALARAADDKPEEAQALNTLGNVYYSLSDYPKTLEHYGRALMIDEDADNKSGVAINIGNIANVYQELSNYPKALEYYSRALKIEEELGNKAGMATNIGNIANIYYSLSDYLKALEYLSQAIALSEELGDKSDVARHTGNIGAVHSKLADYSKALEYHQRALGINEELGNNSGVADNTSNIGNVYYSLSNYAKALEYYRCALAFHEDLGAKAGVATDIGNIGNLYATEDFEDYDADKAEEYLLKAKEINEELETKAQNIVVFKTLAELYGKQKRWQEAYTHYRKYHKLKEEVQSEEAKKQANKFDHERREAEREKALAIERATAANEKKILNNILPEEITTRLIQGESPIADHFDCVSILFMDIVNFTMLCTKVSAQQLVHLLNAIFKAADSVMREYGLEKIKTIGDAYMAVAGAPVVQKDHALRAAQAALKLLEVMKNLVVNFPAEYGDQSWVESVPEIEVRIGLHCGPVAAGVVGENKFLYDLWGDAVNTAARMESHGEAGRIHVSEEFKNTLAGAENLLPLHFIERGEIEIKGKGIMRTYFLGSRRQL